MVSICYKTPVERTKNKGKERNLPAGLFFSIARCTAPSKINRKVSNTILSGNKAGTEATVTGAGQILKIQVTQAGNLIRVGVPVVFVDGNTS